MLASCRSRWPHYLTQPCPVPGAGAAASNPSASPTPARSSARSAQLGFPIIGKDDKEGRRRVYSGRPRKPRLRLTGERHPKQALDEHVLLTRISG